MESPARRGERVRFRISDIFLATPDEVIPELSNAEELEGTVLDFSDSGLEVDVFALVEISGKRTLVVPVKKLRHMKDEERPDANSK